MKILDILRVARQEHDLRMIYTGSLGLHHVLTILREQGYQNDPTNDMQMEDRIDTHYPVSLRPIARALLDQLAIGRSQTLQELTESIDPAKMERDTEAVRKVLTLLGLDPYISREEQQYRFRNPFLLRIWWNVRGMGE